MKCDANCNGDNSCTSPYTAVKVSDKKTGYSWGKFTYCQDAIKLDEEKGFIVEVLNIETKEEEKGGGE